MATRKQVTRKTGGNGSEKNVAAKNNGAAAPDTNGKVKKNGRARIAAPSLPLIHLPTLASSSSSSPGVWGLTSDTLACH